MIRRASAQSSLKRIAETAQGLEGSMAGAGGPGSGLDHASSLFKRSVKTRKDFAMWTSSHGKDFGKDFQSEVTEAERALHHIFVVATRGPRNTFAAALLPALNSLGKVAEMATSQVGQPAIAIAQELERWPAAVAKVDSEFKAAIAAIDTASLASPAMQGQWKTKVNELEAFLKTIKYLASLIFESSPSASLQMPLEISDISDMSACLVVDVDASKKMPALLTFMGDDGVDSAERLALSWRVVQGRGKEALAGFLSKQIRSLAARPDVSMAMDALEKLVRAVDGSNLLSLCTIIFKRKQYTDMMTENVLGDLVARVDETHVLMMLSPALAAQASILGGHPPSKLIHMCGGDGWDAVRSGLGSWKLNVVWCWRTLEEPNWGGGC